MGKILIAHGQTALRSQIARVVTSAGYGVEFAESAKHALEVAAGGEIEAAIVEPCARLAGLAQALCDKVPRTIVLEDRTEELVQRELLAGAHAFRWQDFDEHVLLAQIRATKALPKQAGHATPPAILK